MSDDIASNEMMGENLQHEQTEENGEVFYRPEVNGGGDDEEVEQQNQEAQDEMYKSVLNQPASLDTSQLVDSKKVKPNKSINKQPILSRTQLTRSISLKPSISHTVVNELKYIGEQIKVGRFDPNTRSLNENIFQRYWSKHRAELDSKIGKRPSSVLSTKSSVNPLLTSTNDFKHKGSQFKHGKYVSTIDLTKSDGKSSMTSSSNETTFEDKFQKIFTPRLERLMPKPQPKSLSYFELKVSAKIRNLNEFYNGVINCSLPVANSGADIEMTLKFFSQELLNILKEVPQDDSEQNETTSSSASTNEILMNNDGINSNLINNKQFDDTSLKKNESNGSLLVNGSNHPSSNVLTTIKELDEKFYSPVNRIKRFPNLAYVNLYNALVNLIEIIPTIQLSPLGQALIHTLTCLAPFLPDDILESLPYTMALTMTTFPKDLQKCIIDSLCNHLLPIALYSDRSDGSFTTNSIPSIIMIVINYGYDPIFYVQLLECLLALKRNLIQDILCSIAYGTYKIRYHATNLLFRYWPKLNPNKSDRCLHYNFIPRKSQFCQSEKCVERKNIANKYCIDSYFSVHGFNSAPPYNVCNECFKEVRRKINIYSNNKVLPITELMSSYCENKLNCKSSDKQAYVICYSSPCINSNQNKPISYCKECHLTKHEKYIQRSNHIFQVYLDNLWKCDSKIKAYLEISIINLLKEVPLYEAKKEVHEETRRKNSNSGLSLPPILPNPNKTVSGNSSPSHGNKGDLTSLIGAGLIGALNTNGFNNTSQFASNLFAIGSTEESAFNKRLLSRYGSYLIISLIDPKEVVDDWQTFGKIISMVVQWFHMVCYIPSDSSGEIISKLRTRFILPWIKTVSENHFELITSCLIPSPPEFAKVGGIWETKSNKSIQIKDEFTKFCDLISYEIVNYDIWDYAMPYWIDSIITDVSDKYLAEFKSSFCKLFDPDMAPFKIEQMHHFISERFEGTSSVVQEQALSWVHILCELEVNMPFSILLRIFHNGLNSLQKLETRALRRREAYSSTTSSDVESSNFNQILSNNPFTVFDTYESFRVHRSQLMLQQMTGQELALLIKEEEEDFIVNNSELNISCCIMMLDMVLKQIHLQKLPKYLGMYNPTSKEILFLMSKHLTLPWIKKHTCKQQFGFLSAENISIVSGNTPSSYCSFCEEYVLWFTFAKDILVFISPKQEIEIPEVNFNYLLDSIAADEALRIANEKKRLDEANTTEQTKHAIDPSEDKSTPSISASKTDTTALTSPKKTSSKTDSENGVWVTSYGIYYFKLSQLQVHLQLFHSLLRSLYRIPDVDAFHNLLVSLKMLIIHGDCLETANKDQKGFLIYCLEKLLIPNLWRLLSAAYCHLNELAVSILVHALVYESARTTLWSLISKDFSDSNWKIRMQAVSRVVAIAQHLNAKKIRQNYNVFSSLAYAFSNLIGSINDIEPIVAQKAISLIETLSEHSFASLICCLELQFDSVIQDRPHIIKILLILFTSTSQLQPILSWDFFLQRFSSLSIESQLMNDSNAITDIGDTGVSNTNNKTLQRKILIAKFASKKSNLIQSIRHDLPGFSKVSLKQKLKNQDSKMLSDENLIEDDEIKANTADSTTLELNHLNDQILHSLIVLLMKFMANDKKDSIKDEKNNIKKQNLVLKNLDNLMNYNPKTQTFNAPPEYIRKSIVVNAFLSGLPMVLDRNLALGNVIFSNVLNLLRYLPAPNIEESYQFISKQMKMFNDTISVNFSIGALNSQIRYSWILSVLIILYKYQYNDSSAIKNMHKSIKYLIQIVINTLNLQYHKCEITTFESIGINPSMLSQLDQRDTQSLNSNQPTANLNNESDDNLSAKLNTADKISNFKFKPNKKSLIDNLNQIELNTKPVKKKTSLIKGIKLIVFRNDNNLKQSNPYKLETSLIESTDKKKKSILLNLTGFFKQKKGTKNSKKITRESEIPLETLTPINFKKKTINPKILGNKLMLNSEWPHGVTKNQPIFKKTTQRNRRSALITGTASVNVSSRNSRRQSKSESILSGESGLCYISCQRCQCRLEYYNEESLSGLILICSTLIHRECALAAPFILDMIIAISRIASKKVYSWQMNSNFYLPGNYTCIAKQFIRCSLHQLAGNEIFYQLFQSNFEDSKILEMIALSLSDFNELNSITALRYVLNDINLQKTFNMDICLQILDNVAIYIEFLPLETQQSHWTLVIQELEKLFHNMLMFLNKSYDFTCLNLIMISLLKVSSISSSKTILEPFAKLLSFILQNCRFKLKHLIDICSLSNRAFTKDRDKQYLPKCILNELIQSVTVKVNCLDRNLLLLLQFAVLDAGGTIYISPIIEDENDLYDPHYCVQTNASDCLKQHISDIIVYIADIHSINRVKQNFKLEKNLQTCLTDDSVGAQLKAGLAQFLALEFTELNKSKDKDSRSIVKYLPWLSNLPPNAQQGAKEFVDCIDHVRFLSWILIGSLTHSALTKNKGIVISYPIPINCGHYIAEHIFYILNGFADHSKTSAIHMSSLFHSFILCQLWTMYCEQIHINYDTESDSGALNAIMEFWTKITPGILQLLSQTKVLADMVNLHFLNLIEGLQQYSSIVLAKLFPMWTQVLFMTPLQGDQLKRSKQCLNYQASMQTDTSISSISYSMLIKCLQRLQYKVAMIELQSSNAAQLYNSHN